MSQRHPPTPPAEERAHPGGLISSVAFRETALAFSLMALFSVTALMVALMPVITPTLQDRFGLSAAEVGLLTSAYLLGYALTQIPAGIASARWGGWVFLGSAACLVLGSLVFAFGSSLFSFLAGRFLQGLGAGTIIVIGGAIVARAVRPERVGFAWGIVGAGWGGGTVIGLFLLPSVHDLLGFKGVVLAAGGFALLLTILNLAQRAVRWRPGPEEVQGVSRQLSGLGRAVANRQVLLLGLFNASSLAVGVGTLVWTPVFFQETRGAGAGAAAYITAGLGLAQLLGNPLGAGAAVVRGARPVIFWSLVGLTLFTLLLPLTPGLAWGFVLVFIVGFFDMSYFAPMFAAVPRAVELSLVGVATASVSMAGVAGSLLAPWFFGVLLDLGAGYAAGYAFLAAFALAGVVGARFLRVR